MALALSGKGTTALPEIIKNLHPFIQAVQQEYWNLDPAEYVRFQRFLGSRLLRVRDGELNEEKYIKEWLTKIPHVPGDVQ